MLLDDFTWLPEFVAFAHRCSRPARFTTSSAGSALQCRRFPVRLLAERMEVSVEQSAGTTQPI